MSEICPEMMRNEGVADAAEVTQRLSRRTHQQHAERRRQGEEVQVPLILSQTECQSQRADEVMTEYLARLKVQGRSLRSQRVTSPAFHLRKREANRPLNIKWSGATLDRTLLLQGTQKHRTESQLPKQHPPETD